MPVGHLAPGPGPASRTASEVVRLVLDAVNRRDVEALIDLVHPDAEFLPILAALEGPVYSGHAGLRRWLHSLELDWEVYETRLERIYDFGTSALALGSWRAQGRTSEVELNAQPGAWHARVREGSVVWWRTYTDRAEALEAIRSARLLRPEDQSAYVQ